MKTILNLFFGTVITFLIAVVSAGFGALCCGIAVADEYALNPDEAGDTMKKIHNDMERIRKRHNET